MQERRAVPRAATLDRTIQTRVALPDGTMLDGAVKDLSAAGAAITGETEGLGVGSLINVAFLFPAGRQITYACEVKHVEPGQGFGVLYVL